MYNAILILCFFIGILFVVFEIAKSSAIQDVKKIEYRYIPRTFEEEQLEPVFVSEIFETMFSQPSPWVLSIKNYDMRKQEKINQYFVNQL